jgi:hypothetical protein
VACPSAPTPLGTALSDFARRKPSEIPSRSRSVSAFHPGTVSSGPLSFDEVALLAARPLGPNYRTLNTDPPSCHHGQTRGENGERHHRQAWGPALRRFAPWQGAHAPCTPNIQIIQITKCSIHTLLHRTADAPNVEAVGLIGVVHAAIKAFSNVEEHAPRAGRIACVRRRRPPCWHK